MWNQDAARSWFTTGGHTLCTMRYNDTWWKGSPCFLFVGVKLVVSLGGEMHLLCGNSCKSSKRLEIRPSLTWTWDDYFGPKVNVSWSIDHPKVSNTRNWWQIMGLKWQNAGVHETQHVLSARWILMQYAYRTLQYAYCNFCEIWF